MTDSLWLNHKEAQHYAFGFTDPAARSALRGIHNLLLECGEGSLSLHYLPVSISPIVEVNILTLYQLVAHLFLNWREQPPEDVSGLSSPQCVRLAEAISFAQSQPSERCKNALLRFLKRALTEEIPNSEQLDLYFCCQLLAVILSNNQLIDDILSGEAERRAKEFLCDWFD